MFGFGKEKSVADVERAYPPKGSFVHFEDISVHYEQFGQGDDVVLIHGSGGSTRDMTFSLSPILSDFMKVTVVDRPGHGWTLPKLPAFETDYLEVQAQADLLWRVLDAIGIKKPILVAHSFGGAVAIAMAIQRQSKTRGLCLLAPVTSPNIPGTGITRFEPVMKLNDALSSLVMAFVSDAMVASSVEKLFRPSPVPEGFIEHFGPRMSLRPASYNHNARQIGHLAGSLQRLSPHYKTLTVPTFVAFGDQDPVLDPKIHGEAFARQVKQSLYFPIKGAGHMLEHTHAEFVAGLVYRLADCNLQKDGPDASKGA